MEEEKVYVLIEDNNTPIWDDYWEEIKGVFKTEKQAEFAKQILEKENKKMRYTINEYNLNEII